MVNKIYVKNMRSLETLKSFIRPLICKLGKCITKTISDSAISLARVDLVQDSSYSDVCKHIFHPEIPNGTQQGVLKTCFKISCQSYACMVTLSQNRTLTGRYPSINKTILILQTGTKVINETLILANLSPKALG